MLDVSNAEPCASEAVAGWYSGTVCRLWAGAAPAGTGDLKKSQRWVPYQAGRGWRLGRLTPGQTRPVDFHGGNAQPLTMTEVEAIALAAALNRRPDTGPSLSPERSAQAA